VNLFLIPSLQSLLVVRTYSNI